MMNKNATLSIVVGAVLVTSFAFLGGSGMLGTKNAQATATTEPLNQIAGQVDLKGKYDKLFDGGFFKLLIDTTPTPVQSGHVAISNVRCDSDGNSVFALVIANALTGPGTTQFDVIALGPDNLVNDISDLGDLCTYHHDVNAADHDFPITDFALANTDPNRSKSLSDVASATYNLLVSPPLNHSNSLE